MNHLDYYKFQAEALGVRSLEAWTYTPNALNSLSQMHGFSATRFADEGRMQCGTIAG
jgi:hypothetical protein